MKTKISTRVILLGVGKARPTIDLFVTSYLLPPKAFSMSLMYIAFSNFSCSRTLSTNGPERPSSSFAQETKKTFQRVILVRSVGNLSRKKRLIVRGSIELQLEDLLEKEMQ